jgi:hypothetical protein
MGWSPVIIGAVDTKLHTNTIAPVEAEGVLAYGDERRKIQAANGIQV